MNEAPVAQIKISPVFYKKVEILSVFLVTMKIRPVFENMQGAVGGQLS